MFLADIGPLAWTRLFTEYISNEEEFLHGDLLVFNGNCNRYLFFEVIGGLISD